MTMQTIQGDMARRAETFDDSRVDALLDEALKMTFPASDPIAINLDQFGSGASGHHQPTDD